MQVTGIQGRPQAREPLGEGIKKLDQVSGRGLLNKTGIPEDTVSSDEFQVPCLGKAVPNLRRRQFLGIELG